MFKTQNPVISLSFLILFICGAALASSVGEQESIAVTIYNNDFAMVKDVRSFKFDKGNSFIYFTDVSSNIQTETVTFKPLDQTAKISVYEQNFQRNLINTNSILSKYIEKDVELYVTLGQSSRRVKGKLLGYNSGYIIQTANGINVFNKIDAIQFPELPDGFFTKPTLNWKVNSQTAVETDCEVAYRTTGFSWKSDYLITLNADETVGDIGGWVTIDNNSGKKYENAKLKLIAGDVNTVSSSSNNIYYRESYMEKSNAAPSFNEKSFGDYHLYTLSDTVHLNESSQKQVQFIPKVYKVPLRKFYVVDISTGGYTQNSLKASNNLKFLNSEQNGLGIPFPKGTVRVFKQDQDDGSLEFVGQDSINHTPRNENISITTGNAFDIVVDKYAESRRTIGTRGGYVAQNNITITNHKDTAAEVEIRINQRYGDNLKITWENQKSLGLSQETSSLLKLVQVIQPEETFVAEWTEDYQP